MNLILCGMPMCGKTTLGKLAAEFLQRPFYDTDNMIEEAYGKQRRGTFSCREIYVREGAAFFRELERRQINALGSVSHAVISLGGGALSNNTAAIKSLGTVIYIKSPTDVLWARISSCGTPPYLDSTDPKSSFESLLQRREAEFLDAATATIEVHEHPPHEILKKLLQLQGNHSWLVTPSGLSSK